MGNLLSSWYKDTEFRVHVTTGDKQGAGTDANVWIELADASGSSTRPVALDKLLKNDHERGHTESYDVSAQGLRLPESLDHIVIWRDNSGLGDAWYLDRVEVEDRVRKQRYVFPVHRWIAGSSTRYDLYPYDAFIPQLEPSRENRKAELTQKKKNYQYREYNPQTSKGPRLIAELPEDEAFSEKYTLDMFLLKTKLMSQKFILKMCNKKVEALKDIQKLYSDAPATFYRPASVDMWMDDKWFGRQRVQGVNPVLVKLCKEIPEKLPVTSEMLQPFLEGKGLLEALFRNRMFIVDLEILNNVKCKGTDKLVSPIALFYLNKKEELIPVCIQLFQEPGPDNPLYFPTDPELTWTMAKMFFNMADAQYHQSITHLGLTHLLMESMCVATNHHLSPSHPIFRLLAPHFLYILAINKKAIEKLLSEGGWVDKSTTVGVQGLMELVDRGFKRWHLDTHGSVIKELESRGVLDPKILPNYPYRDDAVDLYNVIESYVSKVVNFYYDLPEKLKEDYEIQAWCREMALPQAEGGLGIGGMPDHIDTNAQLIQICTTIVSTSSLGHAAANFQQYDAYGFLPNYPGILVGLPPKQKRNISEDEFLAFLPSMGTILDTMVITQILSRKGTKSLGDFEVKYLYHPKVEDFADQFRSDLNQLSFKITERNKKRQYPYEWLDPVLVPNSIGI